MNLAHLDILIIASHIDIVTQNGNASIDAGLQLQIKINQEIYKLINLYNSPSDSKRVVIIYYIEILFFLNLFYIKCIPKQFRK